MKDMASSFVQLAKLALSGRPTDVSALVRRELLSLGRSRPDLSGPIGEVLALASSTDPTRAISHALPVDGDSRLELLRREFITELQPEPVWSSHVSEVLEGVVAERAREPELLAAGLTPTRSLLFVGRPGVGKTLAARWLALRLDRPLLTLDLAAVMSSFLGKTGNNIRAVLDFARRSPAVLLLDEFDAIAKRRDDASEIGELKRLVTVLLQAVDDWPPEGLLIAASNHPELLDPAVWRRFDQELHFPVPSFEDARAAIERLFPSGISADAVLLTAAALTGKSFAEIAKIVYSARRRAVLDGTHAEASLLDAVARLCQDSDATARLQIAKSLHVAGRSQREIRSLTGFARDTLRKHGIVGH